MFAKTHQTHPPPCFTVGKTHLSFYPSHGCCHTHLTPSEQNSSSQGVFFSCWFWNVPGVLRLLRRGGSSCRLGGGSLRQTTVNKQVLWFVPTKYEWIHSDILNGLLCFAIQMDSWEFPETSSSDPAAGCYCLRRPSCRTETNHQRDSLPPISVPCLLVFSKLLAGFFLCASSLEVASFLLGRQPCDQSDAVCSVWSERWQSDPPPLNICGSAGSTHLFIFQRQCLDRMLSTCTQLRP